MPGKNQKRGVDFKTLSIQLSPEAHKQARIRSAETGVAIAEICRMALADDELWERAAEAREAERAQD